MLFCTGLPITAVMVPVYGLFVQLNLVDTLGGTIMFMATTSLPFAIWLTKTFMDGVPISLEEAAWVDGAGNMQALYRIVLPLMWPGIAVVLIFTFIGMWGNFFVPFMLLLSPERLPASVSIFTFFGQYGEPNYGQLAAYSLIYTLPGAAAVPAAQQEARWRLRPGRRHQGLSCHEPPRTDTAARRLFFCRLQAIGCASAEPFSHMAHKSFRPTQTSRASATVRKLRRRERGTRPRHPPQPCAW